METSSPPHAPRIDLACRTRSVAVTVASAARQCA